MEKETANKERYLNITLKNQEEDEKNQIIAIWNDESHYNNYLAKNKNYRMLNPSF